MSRPSPLPVPTPSRPLPSPSAMRRRGESVSLAPDRSPSVRVACDSLVALAGCTVDGTTLFAKNSDRPAREPQVLCEVTAGTHGPGEVTRATWIEIPRQGERLRVVGSRPWWCWGFEHGVNEAGVAIGNHTVFSRDEVRGVGLIGMDLVRLALEEAPSAAAAVRVLTTALERYGQGGSGFADKEWPYHNSFLIADPTEAFVLETSDRQWAWRRVEGTASLSNHLTLGTDWEKISPGAEATAVAAGWWSEEAGRRFDFAAAFRDTSVVPEVVSSGRLERSQACLRPEQWPLSAAALRAALRDHGRDFVPPATPSFDDPGSFTLCMHADPVGTTTASLVAELAREAADRLLWVSLGAPCIGIFLPLFPDLPVPPELQEANGGEPEESLWWRFHELLGRVERNWTEHLPRVRDAFDPFEAATAAALPGLRGASRAERAGFVTATVAVAARRVDELLRRLA